MHDLIIDPPSKSTVPDPSASTSSMIPSRSSDVSWLSSSLRISFKLSVEIYLWIHYISLIQTLQLWKFQKSLPFLFSVIDSECFLQFLPQCFLILLYEKLCCKLAELWKLKQAWAWCEASSIVKQLKTINNLPSSSSSWMMSRSPS